MGIFSRKTDEQKQADLQAKLAKAQRFVDGQKAADDAGRAKFQSDTLKYKIKLAKWGVDVGEADGILWNSKGNEQFFIVTMPNEVRIYTLGLSYAKVKNVDTIPYASINSIQHESKMLSGNLTMVTSGQTYEFPTLGHGQYIVDIINERR